MKINLTLKPDFNLIDAFSLLDRDCKSEVNPTELKRQLAVLNLDMKEDDLVLFFNRYAETDNAFTYSNFSDAFLPCDEYYCRLLIGKRLQYNQSCQGTSYFECETRQMYVNLWDSIIRIENMAESIRRKLIGRQNFGLLQAFKSLDQDFDGFIST